MKRVFLFFLCIMLLAFVSGCSQPESQQVQPTAAPVKTTIPRTTSPMITTPVPTTLFITQETTLTVSDNTISIQNMAFNPPTMTVKKGAIVRWVNMDSFPHSIKFAKASGIDPSDPLSTGQGFSVKFDNTGTFAYICAIHPSMQGTIIVV
ncbi:MAG: plastocyanin/azurin family copper-binding protein [Methanoregula sp.]|nr:plastocyanin/azurin family copper-binding protein [Methanoregula sp.]